jgi:hypothetical protein
LPKLNLAETKFRENKTAKIEIYCIEIASEKNGKKIYFAKISPKQLVEKKQG